MVSDYDLAFANPTQSLMVQDRSGAADGTCSASGVTQVQPVVQLNATAARIGTSAATPTDGDLQVSGDVGVGIAPDGSDWNANSKIVHAYQNDGHGAMFKAESSSTSVVVSAASKGYIATLEEKDLAFWTNGSERLTIASGGHVAIGSTDNGAAGSIDLSVGNPGTTTGGITLWSTTSSAHSLGFGDANSGTARYEGYVEYNHSNNSMALATAHTPRLTISSTGAVTVQGGTGDGDGNNAELNFQRTSSTGNVLETKLIFDDADTNFGDLVVKTKTTASSGAGAFTEAMRIAGSNGVASFSGGIAFSQTNTSATGATATGTTLDHYEEGTWTPAYSVGAIAGSSITYTGRYTRIGKLVHIYCKIAASANDLVIGNYVGLSGLPFTAAATASGFSTTEDFDLDLGGEVNVGSTTMYFGATGSATSTQTITATLTYEV